MVISVICGGDSGELFELAHKVFAACVSAFICDGINAVIGVFKHPDGVFDFCVNNIRLRCGIKNLFIYSSEIVFA